MTARLLTLPAALAALFALSGCYGPDNPPPSDEKPEAKGQPNLPVAPPPRAKEDRLPTPPADVLAPRPSKPWSELIIGKWLKVRNGTLGDHSVEFTRDGKRISRYTHPKVGLEMSTHEYRLSGTMLIYPSIPQPFDDGFRVTHTTTFIESLTDYELITLSIHRSHLSAFWAQEEASRRKVPVEVVLNEVREERGRTYYVRFKDKDK